MGISLGNALKSVKDDEHWVKKTLIGGLLSIVFLAATGMMEAKGVSIGIRAAGTALYLIFGSIILGFLLSTANKKLNSDFEGWTEWSEPNIMQKGLKFIFSYLVYGIVITFLFILTAIVLTIAVSLVLGLIYYLIGLIINITPPAAKFLSAVIFTVLITVFSLYFMQFISAAMVSYYKNQKFHDFMALKKHFRIIKENQHAAWTLVGKTILYTLLFMLVFFAVGITIVGIVLIPFIYFAALNVIMDLYVQYGKEIEVGRYLE